GFVQFNHSIHVQMGFGCVTCHGRVDQMPLMWQAEPLTMEWCLDCHRNPERFVRPRERVFEMDWQPENQEALGAQLARDYRLRSLISCSTCHY
ncbi:MAG TPA: cytochrome c3 family protein, partial [Thermoanaerobaculia bacterium]|nr:cytochrome c3 family protein [Thermoanaerobaculia bacterium]